MSCPLGCWGGSTGISIGVRVYTDSASLEPRLTFQGEPGFEAMTQLAIAWESLWSVCTY